MVMEDGRGADVTLDRGDGLEHDERRKFFLRRCAFPLPFLQPYFFSRASGAKNRAVTANNIEVTKAFFEHPKILVAALNGPAIGLSASLVALADFI
jgi:enoyl-CoA hydratase/carnithine racemase